jgi:hypothetical protein
MAQFFLEELKVAVALARMSKTERCVADSQKGAMAFSWQRRR